LALNSLWHNLLWRRPGFGANKLIVGPPILGVYMYYFCFYLAGFGSRGRILK
jgi:hypothetical protein